MSRKTISYAEEVALKYINDFGAEGAIAHVDEARELWHNARRGKGMVLFLTRVKKHIERIKKAAR